MTPTAASAPAALRLPRVRAGFVPRRGEGEVVLTALRRGVDVVIGDPHGVVWDLLGRCDGRRTTRQLVIELDGRAAPAQVEAMLSQLATAGVLLDGAGDRDDASANVRFMLEGFGGDAAERYERLRAATVCVLGCGGVGSWAALTLAAHHVGALRLVDPDVVEASNLGRQAFLAEHVGAAKADAMADLVRAHGHPSRVEPVRSWARTADDVASVAEACDFVLVSADEPSMPWVERMASTALVPMGIPHMACGYNGPVLRCGPTWQGPGSGACCACAAAVEQYVGYEMDDEQRAWAGTRALVTGTTSLSTQVAAALGAQDAIHVLAGGRAPHCGVTSVLSLAALVLVRREASADPECRVCGRVAATASP